MAKSKYSPALFEVINRQRNTGSKLSVPKWWKGSGDQSQPPQSDDVNIQAADSQAVTPIETATDDQLQPATDAPETRLPVVEAVAEESAASSLMPAEPDRIGGNAVPSGPSVRPLAPAAGRPGLFQVTAGRVLISLNPIQACVVGGLILVAMLISFELGRGLKSTGTPQAGTDEVSKLANSTPNGSVLESPGNTDAPPTRGTTPPGTTSGDKSATGTQRGGLQPGRTYVVLEKYPRDHLKSAEHTRDWLAAHGIEATVYSTKEKDSFLLVSNAGFDYSVPAEKEQCEQLIQQIKSLGADCGKELMKKELPVYNLRAPFAKKY